MNYNRIERATGCRIDVGWTYKGMNTLVLQNEKLRISLLLDKGGDIFEILYKPRDLELLYRSPQGVQNPAHVNRGPTNGVTSFFDSYEGGWQEVFPTASGGCEYQGALFGLHGEVAIRPWSYEIIEDCEERVSVRLTIRTLRSPYLLVKEITLKQGETRIWFDEWLTNEGKVPLKFMWGHHPAFGAPFIGPRTRLDLPACKILTHPVVYSEQSQFPNGVTFSWPNGYDQAGEKINLHVLTNCEGHSDMLYAAEFQEGWAALTNFDLGVGVGFRWMRETFPYLWIWNESGGNITYPWYGRARALAIEPFSSLPGTGENGILQAIDNGTACTILPDETISTSFCMVIYEAFTPVSEITAEGVVILD